MPATLARVRSMRWADIAVCAELEQELFPHDAWSTETFWAELARVPESRCCVVAIDPAPPTTTVVERVIGYAVLMTVGDDADVQTVAVAPAAQGRGVGRLLLRTLMRTAVDRGCTRLHLEVRDDNVSAIALYDAHEFETIGRRRDYYGAGIDAVTMMRRLP